jgi:predicted nucleic acid-binding Zn ribbon protein
MEMPLYRFSSTLRIVSLYDSHKATVYWPKVTHDMKRASHVGCNACNARIQLVLHRICYSNVAHVKRAFRTS